jgi:hypothetical protein
MWVLHAEQRRSSSCPKVKCDLEGGLGAEL